MSPLSPISMGGAPGGMETTAGRPVGSAFTKGAEQAPLVLWGGFPAYLLVSVFISSCFGVAFVLDASHDGKIVSGVAAVVALAGFHSALFRPRYFPLVIVAFLPFNTIYPIQADRLGVNMTNFLLLMGMVAWMSARFGNAPRVGLGGFEVLLGAFLALGVANSLAGMLLHETEVSIIGTALGQTPLDALLALKRWLTPFMLFFLVRALVQDRRDVRHILIAVMYSSLLAGALTWIDGVFEVGETAEDGRVQGILMQPNSMGEFLAYASMPFLAFFLIKRRRARRLAYLAAFLLMVRSLLYTFSRGAYVALALGAAVILLFRNPVYLAVPTGAVAMFPELIPDSVRLRMGRTVSGREAEIFDDRLDAGLEKSVDQRLVLWRAGLDMVRDYPWMGVGLGRFSLLVDQYTEMELAEDAPRDAHNAYLLAAAELGLPALALMVLLLLWLGGLSVASYFKSRSRFGRALSLAFLGTETAVVASCMFGSRFSDAGVIGHFWVLAALVVALRRLERRSRQQEREALW